MRAFAISFTSACRIFPPATCCSFAGGTTVPAKHCAIATSRDTMIHAHDGARVCEIAISPFWRRRAAFAFAFPGVAN